MFIFPPALIEVVTVYPLQEINYISMEIPLEFSFYRTYFSAGRIDIWLYMPGWPLLQNYIMNEVRFIGIQKQKLEPKAIKDIIICYRRWRINATPWDYSATPFSIISSSLLSFSAGVQQLWEPPWFYLSAVPSLTKDKYSYHIDNNKKYNVRKMLERRAIWGIGRETDYRINCCTLL